MTDPPDEEEEDEEIVETKWSPTGFEAPDPEVDDTEVVCAGCGEAGLASEMGACADVLTRNASDAVETVTRHYVHNNFSCFLRLGDNVDSPVQ